jgi:RNA polymerase-binding protein DksA
MGVETMEQKNEIFENIGIRNAGNKPGKKGGSRMQDNFQSRFLDSLKARKEDVEKALHLLRESQKEHKELFSEDNLIEDFDQASHETSINRLYILLERKSSELKKIDFLINRVLKEGEFGLCEECGKKIPEKRLLIIPDATLCISCQSELENFGSRRKLSGRPSISSRIKSRFKYETEEDFDDGGEFVIETDLDDVLVTDFGETDPEDTVNDEK